MDQESLEQIRQIVTEATQGLRTEMQAGLTGLRQDMGSLAGDLRQGIASSSDGLRREMGSLAGELRREIIAASEENKRHTGVLYDDLQHKIELVIEGQQGIKHEVQELREKMDEDTRDTRALLRASYQDLHLRVERLEHRS